MFIAHLPAGYLLTKALTRRADLDSTAVFALGLAGSLFPDIDLVRNFLLDDHRIHHHRYWTHLPAYWLPITAVLFALLASRREDRRLLAIACVFLPNVWLHLVLDTWVGHIAWAWPIDDRFFAAVYVPRRHGWYVWSFLFHWTFLLEIAITSTATLTVAVSRASLVHLKQRIHVS